MKLTEMLGQYEELLDKKDQLAKDTKDNNAAIDKLKAEIAEMMIDEDIPSQGYQILINNSNIYDGAALFGKEHKNLLASGTGVTQEAMQTMIMALANQKDQFGESIIINPARTNEHQTWSCIRYSNRTRHGRLRFFQFFHTRYEFQILRTKHCG